MTDYENVLEYCEREERARRFANRDRAVVNFLLYEFPELKDIPKSRLIDFATRTQTIARRFREVMEAHQEWLTDEERQAKIRTEQETQLSLGYSPNYQAELSKLKTL